MQEAHLATPNIKELIANCAKEQIQTPGAIQDCGLLFLVDYESFDLLQVSQNVVDALGIEAVVLLETHKNLKTLFDLDDQNVEALKDQGGPALCDISRFNNAKYKHMLAFVHPSRFQEGQLHSPEIHAATMIVEAELLSDMDTISYIQSVNKMLSRLNSFQLKLSSMRDLTTVCQSLAREIQAVSSYDRVMMYEFDRDWHGHVIAEENANGVPVAYLGIHFPASDIPPQARQLYTINKFRMISDVNYKSVPLVPPNDPRTNQPTDLTHSVFRSVSPVHVEYLRNMEVRASFSVSIVVNDKLWGLVACHHLKGPKFLSHTIRSLCLSIGNVSSAHIQNLVNKSHETEMGIARTLLLHLEKTFQKATWSGVATVSEQFDTILRVFNADYGLVSIMGETKILGSMELREASFTSAFLEWVNSERPSTIIITDHIINTLPVFNKPHLKDCSTSGLIYIPLSLLSPCFLAFFRLEQVYYVNWAGKEEDKIFFRQGEKSASLRPRNSFQIWTEEVRKKCRMWSDIAGDAAKQTQQIMSRFVEMWRAEQLKAQIQQRDALMAQLEQDKNQAEESSRLKSRFMATVSHEVRTPLNAIIGMVESTLHTELDNKQREYLTSVQFAADSLLRIVNDVLDISKIESGKVEVAQELFNLLELVNDTTAIFRSTIEQKHLKLNVEQDESIPQLVIGDPGKVRQILSNLLANAQKFTDRGTVTVEHKLVAITDTVATIELIVGDTGIGIPASRLEAIFEPFELADQSLSRRYAGAGLGLSICKQLVTAMGGKVWAESIEGEGSKFHVSLKFLIGKALPLSPTSTLPPNPLGLSSSPPSASSPPSSPPSASSPPSSNRFLSSSSVDLHPNTSLPPSPPSDSPLSSSSSSSSSSPSPSSSLVRSISSPSPISFYSSSSSYAPSPALLTHSVSSPSPLSYSSSSSLSRSSSLQAIHQNNNNNNNHHQSINNNFYPNNYINSNSNNNKNNNNNDLLTPPHVDVARTRPLRVLVAEDNELNQKVLLNILRRMGHEAITAWNGEEAVNVFFSADPPIDLVLMDLFMPTMDGITATRLIRARESLRTPIVAVTAQCLPGDKEACLKAGMDAYLSKPVKTATLQETILRVTTFGMRDLPP